MSIEIEQGKMLIIKLLAIGTLDTKKGTRECFFEMNGEVRAVIIEDRDAAIENVTREKATSDPGSVGSPMVSVVLSLTGATLIDDYLQAGVVIEVRVTEGAQVKAGDPLCVLSAMKVRPGIQQAFAVQQLTLYISYF
jgi:pyruvate carboxylase